MGWSMPGFLNKIAYGNSVHTNDLCRAAHAALEWKVLDPCSFIACFPPKPDTWQVTSEHRLPAILGMSCPECWIFTPLPTDFVNLAILGTSWEWVILSAADILFQKVVRANLISSFLRGGIEGWQGSMPTRQPPCQERPDPGPKPVPSALFTPCSIISCSHWTISSQTTF